MIYSQDRLNRQKVHYSCNRNQARKVLTGWVWYVVLAKSTEIYNKSFHICLLLVGFLLMGGWLCQQVMIKQSRSGTGQARSVFTPFMIQEGGWILDSVFSYNDFSWFNQRKLLAIFMIKDCTKQKLCRILGFWESVDSLKEFWLSS